MRPIVLSLLGLSLAVTCCGAPTEPEPGESPEPATVAPEPEHCGMVFSPSPELLEATEIAAARWSAATGCDVRVGEGGLPMTVLDEVIDLDGDSKTARTTFKGEPGAAYAMGIEVRRDRAWDFDRLVAHEMGHALGGHGHTETGVMKGRCDTGAPIDAVSLGLVCENLSCASFATED